MSTPQSRKKVVGAYKLKIKDIMAYSRVSEHGLTTEELKAYFSDVCMRHFGLYLDGQTCALTPDHQLVVYPEDIDRFVRNIRFPGPDLWD